MQPLYCGVDFGTTNTSVAVCDKNGIRALTLDPHNDTPTSLPSLLYISREGEKIVGRQAANAFIQRNVDREVKTRQVDLGVTIEAYVGAEPDKSDSYNPALVDANICQAVRARATLEVNSPGRLFQSLKTLLHQPAFKSTEVFGTQYQLEELVAYILEPIKKQVDKLAGTPVERAVFGRPVLFSEDKEENALAEMRLRTAAKLVGFKEVLFFYEPVGACVEYAVDIADQQRLMVVDIGGGTCDVCIMEFQGGNTIAERLASSRILGVAGTPVAGDALDREIIRTKLFPLFGSRARYGPAQLPMPQHIYNQILDWQNIYKLNTEETINWLLAAEASSDYPEGLRALRCLIRRNYGYLVAREVEATKKRLSETNSTHINITREDIVIHDLFEREEFSHIIESILERMLASIVEAERCAGVSAQELNFVLTTGGTCLVPAVQDILKKRFGKEKIRSRDTFTSVATGLAVVAQHAV
ncbi:MAG: Hsp70 family protein [Candidatus Hydrogenedentes bacterium]|nr:Hsp70 family protein [Candidatus Hydrogenedentota bacterium]